MTDESKRLKEVRRIRYGLSVPLHRIIFAIVTDTVAAFARAAVTATGKRGAGTGKVPATCEAETASGQVQDWVHRPSAPAWFK